MISRRLKIDSKRLEAPDVLLLVYPHFGVVDSWLPILCDLKRQRNEISIGAIFPANALSLINSADFVTREANKFIDLVMVQGHGQNWTSARTFERALAKMNVPRPITFCRTLFTSDTITAERLSSCTRAVLFDIMQIKIKTINNLQSLLPDAKWFSLPHGIDRIEGREYLRERIITKVGLEALKKIFVYASSNEEAITYADWFGIEEKNIRVVGVPRHCETWVEKICESESHAWMDKRYILLVSRPTSDFFPEERKMERLSDLRVVAREVGARIIVRLHPREGSAGSNIYEAALGAEAFGKAWTFSASHPIALGRRALCAVTFHSSVAIDMAAVGVPVIEARDFSDLFDAPQLTRDRQGNPTSHYQQLGFVLGARDRKELRQHVLSIVADRKAVTDSLRRAYDRAYKRVPNSVELIAEDVSKVIDRA